MIGIKNKKADNRILSFWFFLVLIIIAVGIAAGHYFYYSDKVNINYDESRILSNRLIDSLVFNGYLNERVFDDNFDIFLESKLNKDLFVEDGEFYFEVVILKEEELKEEEIKILSYGNKNIRVESQITGKDFAEGYYNELDVLNKKDKEIYKIKVLTASKQGSD